MSDAPARSSYRHGDLRQALIDAALDMARQGGPDAVVLREATRRAGVSPNAAYRHFADRRDLLEAASASAQGLAADAMEDALEAVHGTGDPAVDARLRVGAVGRGYLAFARHEPGLFRTAFTVPNDLSRAFDADKAGRRGRTPFQVLAESLDALHAAGVLPDERRQGAELLAWSTVHGLGMLALDGPLRGLTDEMLDGATERLLLMVDRGL
ncbi:TetR/AcrR family transcriptional regulator [Arenivirga flava]|uniref:TetR family transcriptional regulator n=1 Tax=Arenivirga flava TaxID=1930060 RepID=A0AA37UP94_9MICO|nr:TetR/AcrR family transcriptional regulator [Arenivirga flava]GMA29667.1 TetR family transcriptional regulator [Arenivirga flava]